MNFVPCLTWVSRGVAESVPQKLQLTPEELKCLIKETKEMYGEVDSDCDKESDEDNCDDSDKDDAEQCGDEYNEPGEDNKFVQELKEEKNGSDDEDFETKYNLDSYDNDEEDCPVLKITDVAMHVDNRDDQYITGHDSECEDELEEKEDFIIKETDNLLVVGHIEDESCVMEVYVYNKNEDAFYVHHDIVLPSYPLALEWLNFHPADDKPGNYVAVGDMTSVIKIWDLDVVDVLEPDYVLGETKKKKKKASKADEMNFHSDAVLSLSWNKHMRNILASGSADSTIVLWDLTEGKPSNKLCYHTNKVQSLQWHPVESPFLLSGCTDGFAKLYDCRTSESEVKSWKMESEIEKVTWNLLDSFKFFCSTDKGEICSMDVRNAEIQHCIKAHNEAVTGLDMSPLCPNILISASMDRTMKAWNIENKMEMVKSWKLKVGSIYAAKAAPDLHLTIAVGGNNASNSLKIMDISEDIKGSAVHMNKIQNLEHAADKQLSNIEKRPFADQEPHVKKKNKKSW